jgi:hypothetical protein
MVLEIKFFGPTEKTGGFAPITGTVDIPTMAMSTKRLLNQTACPRTNKNAKIHRSLQNSPKKREQQY